MQADVVAGDAAEPGEEVRVPAEDPPALPRREDRLLEEVLRVRTDRNQARSLIRHPVHGDQAVVTDADPTEHAAWAPLQSSGSPGKNARIGEG